MKTRSAVTFVLVALFVVSSVAALAPETVYAPKSEVPTLGAHFCKATLLGTWTGKTKTCYVTSNLEITSSIGSFQIPSKATLAIMDVNALTIDSGITITVNTGGTINNAGIIINNGEVDNYGLIHNAGTINNNWGLIYNFNIITNFGTINNNYGAYITNSLDITNFGTINNNSGGTIINYGTINNNSGGLIYNFGNLTNYGTINNSFFLNNYMSINNHEGTIQNSGTINNYSGATIGNSGTIDNSGGTIRNNPLASSAVFPPVFPYALVASILLR
jgi:hypothetical protein